MSASFHSSIGRAGLPTDPTETAALEAAKHERQPHEESAWASAITQALVEIRPRLSLPGAPAGNSEAAASRANERVKLPTLGSARTGELAGTDSVQAGTEPSPGGPPLPNQLIAELSDSRLGRLELSVARGPSGLRIVINVADAHVKALIESEQALLLQSLQACGLSVDSVEIGSQLLSGIALAPPATAQERALARSRGNPSLRSSNPRGRGYGAAPEEEPEADTERVDLTA